MEYTQNVRQYIVFAVHFLLCIDFQTYSCEMIFRMLYWKRKRNYPSHERTNTMTICVFEGVGVFSGRHQSITRVTLPQVSGEVTVQQVVPVTQKIHWSKYLEMCFCFWLSRHGGKERAAAACRFWARREWFEKKSQMWFWSRPAALRL